MEIQNKFFLYKRVNKAFTVFRIPGNNKAKFMLWKTPSKIKIRIFKLYIELGWN